MIALVMLSAFGGVSFFLGWVACIIRDEFRRGRPRKALRPAP